MLSIPYLLSVWLALMLAGIFIEACFEKYIAIFLTPAAAASLVCMISGGTSEAQLNIFIIVLSLLLTLRTVLGLIHKRGVKRIEIEQPVPGNFHDSKDKSHERNDKYDAKR